jgi:hypothetical protein
MISKSIGCPGKLPVVSEGGVSVQNLVAEVYGNRELGKHCIDGRTMLK